MNGVLGRLSLYGGRPFPFWYTIGANYNRKQRKSCDPRQCPVFPFRAAKGAWYVKSVRLKGRPSPCHVVFGFSGFLIVVVLIVSCCLYFVLATSFDCTDADRTWSVQYLFFRLPCLINYQFGYQIQP